MKNYSSTRYAILGFLTWGPMSGYDLRQAVETSVGDFWNESFGQIYPQLEKLLKEERICLHSRKGRGKRKSKVYAITALGESDLEQWLDAPTQPERSRDESLLKLFFGKRMAPEATRATIAAKRTRYQAQLSRNRSVANSLREQHAENPDLPFWLATLRYNTAVASAVLEWCDETEAALATATSAPPATDISKN